MSTNKRIEALSLGLTHYDTGKPCKNGHTARRYAKSGACMECIKVNNGSSVQRAVTQGDMLKSQTTVIYIFSNQESFTALKMTLDAMLIAKFPNMNIDYVNPWPFKAKQLSVNTYQLKVRVPTERVDEMYNIAKTFLRPDGVIS